MAMMLDLKLKYYLNTGRQVEPKQPKQGILAWLGQLLGLEDVQTSEEARRPRLRLGS